MIRPQVRASSRRLGALTALLLLTGCGATGVPVAAERIDGAPAAGLPFVRVDASGPSTPAVLGGLRPDESAALSVLTDLQDMATGELDLPGVLSGGYAAVASGSGAFCVRRTADLLGTAFFCPEQDAIVADAAALVPALRGHYGDGAFAATLAHEFGHAVQARAGWGQGAPALLVEAQADCFAGAFLARAAAGSTVHVHVPEASLVRAVAALLDFRDAPGSDPDAASAHGSATDRLRALDGGYRRGAASCGALTAAQVRATTTLGLPDATGSGFEVVDDGAGMAQVLTDARLPVPVGDTGATGDPGAVTDGGPVARAADAALRMAGTATGGDARWASCLLGAWVGQPPLRSAADQALDRLRSRPDATYADLQAFSAGVDGGVTAC